MVISKKEIVWFQIKLIYYIGNPSTAIIVCDFCANVLDGIIYGKIIW